MGADINNIALLKKMREKEETLADTNDKSFLTFLKDNKLLTLPKLRIPPMTGFSLLKLDSNQARTLMYKAFKL